MTKISLRAYNQEIGKLIEHGQTEEASAHCKYILKLFPKHLDTYRLLGKTYLESQRYSEAADILQRILAVVPDDFVAQIGLSIIREDEGNLDAAIWNMERAFEVQPSNAAVQEELRRLYGNRDGVQPPRVRLTRGALVRMYTKGNLYQQAIAEARAAIAESPKRTDLEILLARNYYLSKNHAAAIEVCSRLVKKMPYCLEANRILAEILPKVNKLTEAQVFAKRMQELDPYTAFIDNSTPNAAKVPDEAVSLEKLNWQPSMEDTEQPRWAKSIGVSIDDRSEEATADWLTDMPAENADSSSPMPFIIPEISSSQSEDVLPGWMKEDDWNQKDANTSNEESSQSSAFIMDDAEELQEADMPEWLQSLAPGELDQGQPQMEASPFEFSETESTSTPPDWINDIDAGQPAEPEAEAPFIADQPASEENVPEWMQELTDGEGKAEAQPVASSINLPDFSDAETETTPDVTPEEETPDWLKGLESTAGQTQQNTTEQPGVTDMLSAAPVQEPETPEWLSDINAETQSKDFPKAPPDTSEETPDWLQNLEDSSNQSAMPAIEQPGLTDMLGAPSHETKSPEWLNDMKKPAEAETTPPSETSSEETPDWLKDLESDATGESAIPASPGITDMLSTPQQETEVPDWLSDIVPDEQTEPAPVEDAPAEIFQEKPTTSTSLEVEDLPDWLKDIDSSDATEQPESPHPISETSQAEDSDIDEILSAAAVGASALIDADKDENTERISATQSSEDVPEWLSELDPQQSTSSEVVADNLILPSESTSEPDASQQELLSTEAAQPANDLPDWLGELDASKQEEAPSTPIGPEDETLILPTEKEDAPVISTSDEMPEDPDETFAWLESLAAKHGAEEETLSTPPEEMDTTVPDWLQEISETTPKTQQGITSDPVIQQSSETIPDSEDDETIPAADVSIPKESPSAASLPDWLQEMDIDDSGNEATPQPASDKASQKEDFETAEQAKTPSEALPDWLMAPDTDITPDQSLPEEAKTSAAPEITDELVSKEHTSDDTLPDWMDELSTPVEEKPIASTEKIQPEAAVSLPAWMNELGEDTNPLDTISEDQNLTEETPAEIQQPEETDVSIPDWMSEFANADSAPEAEQPQEEADNIPAWSQSTGIPADAMPPAEKSTSIPDWLTELKPADVAPENQEKGDKPVEEASLEPAVPEVIQPEPEQTTESGSLTPSADLGGDDALAWLESLAAKHGAEEETLVTTADERVETPPDWVQELSEDTIPSPDENGPTESAEQAETIAIEDIDTGVDLLSASKDIPTEPTQQAEQAEAEEQAQQWLQSLASGKSMEEITAEKEAQTVIPQPEEDQVFVESIQETQTTEEQMPQVTEQQVSADMPEDPEAAFAWLESLASQHGAEEETLSTPPEERDTTTPDWLQEMDEEPELQPGQKETPVNTPTLEETQTGKEAIDETCQAEETPPIAAVEDSVTQPPHEASLPEWLKEFSDATDEQPTEEPAPPQETPKDETIMRWLSDLEKEEPTIPPIAESFESRSASEEVITEPVKPAENMENEDKTAPVVPAEPIKPVEEQQPDSEPLVEEPTPASELPIKKPEQDPLQEPAPEKIDSATPLSDARDLLLHGRLQEAVELYKPMIEKEEQLNAIIKDLNDALLRHPVDAILWLTLGDAYMQKKEMQSAISAYAKAEEMLR